MYLDALPAEMSAELALKARFLGGSVADSIIACTHFIASSLHRTPHLLEALARGRDVVAPSWIEHSFSRAQFVGKFLLF